MNAIEIRNVTKTLNTFKLDNLNLILPSGCIMGLIGKNGAGKSTTIKLILNMLYKESGTITVLGRDNSEMHLIKDDIGVVMDDVGIPGRLTVKQVGKIMNLTYKNWDWEEYERLLNKLDLPKDKMFEELSRGMKMKLGIAIAMSHKAKLLLLDEATSGLDPVVRDEVVEMFYDFTRDENHSILISSHIVSDLEKLCDYIAFLRNGKLILCEEKDRLLEEYCAVHCTEKQLNLFDESIIEHKKVSPYGIQFVTKRENVPNEIDNISPVSIEELFVFMAKEER